MNKLGISFGAYLNNHATGYVIKTAIYDNEKFTYDNFVIGNAQVLPTVIAMTKEHIFDIASLTKTFTVIVIYRAIERKLLNLTDTISKIDNRFINLNDVTILDLLAHRVELWTDGYLGDAQNKEEFYDKLFNSKVKNYNRTYVDSHYIVLSTILEKIYNKSFNKIVEDEIIRPLNLKHTSFDIKKDSEIVSCNYEHTENKVVEDIYPGIVHDTKARAARKIGIYTGHAGIFTTADDLMKVLVTFIDGKETLLRKKTIIEMIEHDDIYNEIEKVILDFAKNKEITISSSAKSLNDKYLEISRSYQDINELNSLIPRTYNYMGTRFKNPIDIKNDVPESASDDTIVFSGYTGPIFLIDFNKKIVILIMSNVCHNSKISREERKKLSDEMIRKIYSNL